VGENRIGKKDCSDGARVTAASVLLDRGWGKAAQPHTGANGENDIHITIRNIVEEWRDK
jgi:hypothetical protein